MTPNPTDRDGLVERLLAEADDPWRCSRDEQADLMRQAAAALREDARDAEARRAVAWLASGDTGMSSVAICKHMVLGHCRGHYPHDPADLGRCLRLLAIFPEWSPRIGEMAKYSKRWAGLARRWAELSELMADEVGHDWAKGRSAPKTYAAMQNAMQTPSGDGGGG